MPAEFFIVANSFAAPFVSDQSTGYQKGQSAEHALRLYAENYTHPAGLYSAEAYLSADAYHKQSNPQARWLCNKEQAKQKATEGLGSYGYEGHDDGSFSIDGKRVVVEGDPKEGSVAAQ